MDDDYPDMTIRCRSCGHLGVYHYTGEDAAWPESDRWLCEFHGAPYYGDADWEYYGDALGGFDD